MISLQTDLINSLEWRYATKEFDREAKIPQHEMDILLNAIRLSPSSMGLQPYHFIRVQDEKIREKLKKVSFNQSQITDASDLIVFAARTKITEKEIGYFARLNATLRIKDKASEERQISRLSSYINQFNESDLVNWSSKQAYIVKGILLACAAQLKIDACPMEGIEGEEYDRILELEPLNLTTISVVTLGYRSKNDTYQWEPKVRMPLDKLISTI